MSNNRAVLSEEVVTSDRPSGDIFAWRRYDPYECARNFAFGRILLLFDVLPRVGVTGRELPPKRIPALGRFHREQKPFLRPLFQT